MATSGSIEISTYSNPCSDRVNEDAFPEGMDFLGFILREQEARRARDGYTTYLLDKPRSTWDNMGEMLQRIYPDSIVKVPEIDAWLHNIETWMSPEGLPDAQKWWFEQLQNKNNIHLEAMPIEWWRLRARNFFVARDKDSGNQPVGAAALILVYLSERDYLSQHMPENTSPWCYEIRAEVVDEAYQGQGLGRKLAQAALLQATVQQPVVEGYYIPTAGMTTNPVMAHIFKELKATGNPSESDEFSYGYPGKGIDTYNDMLCYSRFKPYVHGRQAGRFVCSDEILPPCEICPKYNKVAWWWPTHNRESMDKLGIFD